MTDLMQYTNVLFTNEEASTVFGIAARHNIQAGKISHVGYETSPLNCSRSSS